MKKVEFSETFAACDLKLIELMKICEYFLTLAKSHLHMNIKVAFLSNHLDILNQILMKACWYKEMKIH